MQVNCLVSTWWEQNWWVAWEVTHFKNCFPYIFSLFYMFSKKIEKYFVFIFSAWKKKLFASYNLCFWNLTFLKDQRSNFIIEYVHVRRNELMPVWDFKLAWKQVLFTWSFISAAFQNDPICSFRVVFAKYFITRNEISFLSKRPIWNPYLQWVSNAHAH